MDGETVCTSTTQLLDLNDDCLLEIFEYVLVHDRLKLLGCLCTRIDDIINRGFSLMKSILIKTLYAPRFSSEQLDDLGRSLRKVIIIGNCYHAQDVALKYLQPFCSQNHIEILSLRNVPFNENLRDCIINTAEQLKDVEFNSCNLTDELLGPILEKAVNLNHLQLFGNPNLRYKSLSCIKSEQIKLILTEDNHVCNDEIENFREKYPDKRVLTVAVTYKDEHGGQQLI